MMLKDISKREQETIRIMKQGYDNAKFKIYSSNDYKFIYSEIDGSIQLSGSTSYGPVPPNILLDAFNQLINKDISNFKLSKTSNALYIIEI